MREKKRNKGRGEGIVFERRKGCWMQTEPGRWIRRAKNIRYSSMIMVSG